MGDVSVYKNENGSEYRLENKNNHLLGAFFKNGKVEKDHSYNCCSYSIFEEKVGNDKAIQFHTSDIQVSPEKQGLGSVMFIYGLTIAQVAGATRVYIGSGVNTIYWNKIFVMDVTLGLPNPNTLGDYYGRLDVLLNNYIKYAVKKGWNVKPENLSNFRIPPITIVDTDIEAESSKCCKCVLL